MPEPNIRRLGTSEMPPALRSLRVCRTRPDYHEVKYRYNMVAFTALFRVHRAKDINAHMR